ncbi:MAG: universal stress protein [Nitrospirae bacterium]|nr:universal stress protein [Nitrospirota bacterium]
MKGYRKVLIAIKGSKEVLSQGINLACDEKCWITVVKVLPPNEGDLNLVGIKNIADVLDNGSRLEAAEIRKLADTEGVMVKTRIEEGDASQKILEVAGEERCDVIVMGAKKRSWLRGIFGDNTVGKVIHQSPCPVLVVGA